MNLNTNENTPKTVHVYFCFPESQQLPFYLTTFECACGGDLGEWIFALLKSSFACFVGVSGGPSFDEAASATLRTTCTDKKPIQDVGACVSMLIVSSQFPQATLVRVFFERGSPPRAGDNDDEGEEEEELRA